MGRSRVAPVPAQGPGRRTTSRAAGSRRSNDDVAYPNLMFHFLPIAVRYDGLGAGERPRLPGPHRPDVTRTREARWRSRTRTRACTRRCGSTTCRPTRTGGSGWRRSALVRRILSQPAFEPFERRRALTGVGGRDRRTDPGVGRSGRRDRPAPLVHLHDGDAADPMAVVDPRSMQRPRHRGLRVVDASVFPSVTNGNIYAPVMMVAEKAADLVLGNTPAAGRGRSRSTATRPA